MQNEVLFHYWLDMKTNKLHIQQHIKVKEIYRK
jgi:hypothetical protein